jgi:hypothetical protein
MGPWDASPTRGFCKSRVLIVWRARGDGLTFSGRSEGLCRIERHRFAGDPDLNELN